MRETENVSITLVGTSDELEATIEALEQSKYLHGFAMVQFVGREAAAHRHQWECLSQVLDRAREAIRLLRIGRL